MDGFGESGQRKNAADYGSARSKLAQAPSPGHETAMKAARNYGGSAWSPAPASAPRAHQHFGPLIVSLDGADLRPMPTGVAVFADGAQHVEALDAPAFPRSEVMDELHAAVTQGKPPLHSGEWARATTEVCLAILESARTQADCIPRLQVQP
jgi:phthalate 4,5-cis-dihydrodiol dehydrogenase